MVQRLAKAEADAAEMSAQVQEADCALEAAEAGSSAAISELNAKVQALEGALEEVAALANQEASGLRAELGAAETELDALRVCLAATEDEAKAFKVGGFVFLIPCSYRIPALPLMPSHASFLTAAAGILLGFPRRRPCKTPRSSQKAPCGRLHPWPGQIRPWLPLQGAPAAPRRRSRLCVRP